MTWPYSGPRAPENNPPIRPTYFAPRAFTIADISLGQTTTVTTDVAHDYVIGQLVKLIIPVPYGAGQLNNRSGYVISLPSTTEAELALVSSGGDAFIAAPSFSTTLPKVIAVGDVNSGDVSEDGLNSQPTGIPGAFKNIS